MKRHNIYKKLIAKAKGAVKAARIPRSFSKRRNNVFSNTQHFCMQVLRQYEELPYRKAVDFFELVKQELNLPRKPHFTTANKFALRAKPFWFEQLIAQTIKSLKSELAAIDGTGFSLNYASDYYQTVAGARKQFMLFNACIELRHKLITAVKLRRKRGNENVDFKPLIDNTSKQLSIKAYLADKAYDSERNHAICASHGARLIAPLRNKVSVHRTKGVHRKQLRRHFPEEIYRKRVLIESGFSALKRKFGDVIYAKKFVSQRNELLCKILAYNLEKNVNLFTVEIYFLQS